MPNFVVGTDGRRSATAAQAPEDTGDSLSYEQYRHYHERLTGLPMPNPAELYRTFANRPTSSRSKTDQTTSDQTQTLEDPISTLASSHRGQSQSLVSEQEPGSTQDPPPAEQSTNAFDPRFPVNAPLSFFIRGSKASRLRWNHTCIPAECTESGDFIIGEEFGPCKGSAGLSTAVSEYASALGVVKKDSMPAARDWDEVVSWARESGGLTLTVDPVTLWRSYVHRDGQTYEVSGKTVTPVIS